MKRMPAFLLSALVLIGAAAPAALAENTAGGDPVSPPGSAAAEAPAPDGFGAASSAPDGEPLFARSAQRDAAPVNTASSLRLTDLRAVVTSYNPTVRSLRAALDDVNGSGSTSQAGAALAGLQLLRQTVSAAQADAAAGAQTNAGDPASDLYRIYSDLAAALMASGKLLDAQILSVSTQLSGADATAETTSNTLNDSINQLIKGAETLYLGIVTMENAEAGVVRTLETLDRAVAITEKQRELGLASAYDLETMRHNRAQADSALESLRFQIKTGKLTLEGMCGMALTGTVQVEAPAAPTAEELNGVDYAKQVGAAANRNAEVLNADAKRFIADSVTPQRTYEAAVASFRCSYKILCETVPEKRRLAAAAQETADYQQRTFEIAAKKYELGMASHEEYLAAQSALDGARDDLAAARLELFTAYRNYVWATQYGIV